MCDLKKHAYTYTHTYIQIHTLTQTHTHVHTHHTLELGDIPELYRYDDILFTLVSILGLNFYIKKPVYHRIPPYHKIPIQISILVL